VQFSERVCRDGQKAIDVTYERSRQPEIESFGQIQSRLMSTRMGNVFENNGVFWSKEEEPKKAPKGFEKFLKKTREGSKPSKEGKKEDNKEDEKKAQKKEEDDDDLSEEEVEPEKSSKKEKEEDSTAGNAKKRLNEFFLQPNGKGPKWENVALVAFLTGAFGFYLATMGNAGEEITYMDFINQYLAQNQVTMITISED
jgi:hypothetical protein